MCGRYTLTTKWDQLRSRFGIEDDLPHTPRYNVAPGQLVLAVLDDGKRHADFLRWGLIPPWARDVTIGNRMINARSETLAESKVFRRPLQHRRCLLPANGFYEWRKEGATKTPMRFVLKSGEPFAFAALWEEWKTPAGLPLRSCTIITTTPNGLMEPVHNRMPVILPKEAEEAWLDRRIEDADQLKQLLRPYQAEEMDAYAVSTLVNSPRNDLPECVEPVP